MADILKPESLQDFSKMLSHLKAEPKIFVFFGKHEPAEPTVEIPLENVAADGCTKPLHQHFGDVVFVRMPPE